MPEDPLDRNGEPSEQGESCALLIVILILCAVVVAFELIWITQTS